MINPYAWLGDMIDRTIKDNKAEITALKQENAELQCEKITLEAKLKVANAEIKELRKTLQGIMAHLLLTAHSLRYLHKTLKEEVEA